MAKSGKTVTDSSGVVWRQTSRGHWRDDKTGKLYSGKGDPGSGAASETPAANQATGPQLAPAGPLSNPFNTPAVPDSIPGNEALSYQQQLWLKNIGQQQAINRPTEISPLGSSRYYQDPVTGQISRVSTIGDMSQDEITQSGKNQAQQFLKGQGLNLGIQGLADTSLNNLRGLLANPIDPNQFGAERDQTTQSQYDRAIKLMQPQIDQQRQQFQQNMANRGLPMGSGEAYDRAQKQFTQNENDAYQSAAFNAMQAGNQEQQRLLQNALTARSAQQGELSGLLGMAPMQMPSFSGTATLNIPTVDANNNWLSYESIKRGGAGGGGGSGYDPIALANLNNAAQMDRLNASNQFQLQQQAADHAFQQQQTNANRPGFGQIAGSIGASFASGLANSFGQSLFGAPSGGGNGFGGFLSNLKFW